MVEVVPGWRAVRGLGGGARTDCQDLARARPVKHEFGREHLGVRVRLHTLADGGGRVVHPCTRSEVSCQTQRVGNGGVSVVNTRTGEGVVRANNVVRGLLPIGGHVEIGQAVVGQTQMSHDAGVVENREGKTWESAHVNLARRQARRRADIISVRKFDVRQMRVPIVLSFVDYHSHHLDRSVGTR